MDYRPHSVPAGTPDWVDDLELEGAQQLGQSSQGAPLRVLVLYGSLRERSFSKFLAYEFARCAACLHRWRVLLHTLSAVDHSDTQLLGGKPWQFLPLNGRH